MSLVGVYGVRERFDGRVGAIAEVGERGTYTLDSLVFAVQEGSGRVDECASSDTVQSGFG